ncbi:MAG: YqeG family HAD IIIA-type phosphatase, partial [Bacillota bacterium]
MFRLLQPDYYYPDIFAIELDKLKAIGIKGIICDIDNTLVPYGEKEFLSGAKKWLADLQDEGFAICLVSNGLQ